MRGEGFKLATVAMSLGLVTAACTSSDIGPATAPSITEPPATAPTTTSPPSTSTTSLATTTTIDRVAEVEAIFKDLELRRLDALFQEDEEAYANVFSHDAYRALNVDVLGQLDFIGAPTSNQLDVGVTEIFLDVDGCLAFSATERLTDVLAGAEPFTDIFVLSPTPEGEWGYAYGGAVWDCSDPHPLDS